MYDEVHTYFEEMAMPLNDAALDVMGNALRTAATHIQLHSGDPGASGTANVTTAARVAAAWPAAATGGDLTITNKAFTGGAASGPVTWVSLWSAATAGTWYGNFQIPASGNDLTFNAAGEYTISSMTLTGTST